MSGWESFFVAQVGASAAVAGLVFVGVSINLDKILKYAGLPGRTLEALIVLILVLITSSLMLVPGQSNTLIGAELLGVGLLAWIWMAALDSAESAAARTSLPERMGTTPGRAIPGCDPAHHHRGRRDTGAGNSRTSTGSFPACSSASSSPFSTHGCCSSRSTANRNGYSFRVAHPAIPRAYPQQGRRRRGVQWTLRAVNLRAESLAARTVQR